MSKSDRCMKCQKFHNFTQIWQKIIFLRIFQPLAALNWKSSVSLLPVGLHRELSLLFVAVKNWSFGSNAMETRKSDVSSELSQKWLMTVFGEHLGTNLFNNIVIFWQIKGNVTFSGKSCFLAFPVICRDLSILALLLEFFFAWNFLYFSSSKFFNYFLIK